MADFFDYPAVWGFLGVFCYAATKLAARLFGPEELTRKQTYLAYCQFVVAMVFGTVAAAGFTETAFHMCHETIHRRAISLGIGLSGNVLWPIVEEGLIKRAQKWGGS